MARYEVPQQPFDPLADELVAQMLNAGWSGEKMASYLRVRVVLRAYEATGNKSQAARILRMNRSKFLRWWDDVLEAWRANNRAKLGQKRAELGQAGTSRDN